MKESVLFWPVQFKDGKIFILDETRLPQKTAYIKVTDIKGAVAAIREMKTRAFGQFLVVLYSFLLIIEKNKGASATALMTKLNQAAEALNNSRPTFPFKEVTDIIMGWARQFHRTGQDLPQNLSRNINYFLAGIRAKRLQRCEKIAALIQDGDSILTHCNVSGELVMAAQICRSRHKKVSFFATETRPYLQGARLTTWELKMAGFPVTLITDNAVAKILREKMVDKVIVGSDRSCANGDIANKIGTYQIALLAREFKVPFYVLNQPSQKVACGRDMPIEIRNEKEILFFKKKRIAPLGTAAFYPAFDVTPRELIEGTVSIDVQ
jgi:methylthioribose-1-phosphate isomerase